ncbi:MAG: Phosphoenolpyruvate-protein phosphotransferase [Chlamydiia bacterium]|nr:Phosphoenolpyruvate-protein phosphotransferase [Chlamydiia bacterium]
MKKLKEEIHLEGIPVSEGIGVGSFFLFKGKEITVPEFAITSTQVSIEIARYRRALLSSREELESLHSYLKDEGSSEVCRIVDTHIQMLQDPIISQSIEEKIAHMRQNTESVFMYVMDEYKRLFRKKMNPDVAEDRLLDIKDLSHRILRHLNPITSAQKDILPHSIFADYEIIPTKAAEAKKGFVEGFISKIGGEMSHSGVIARAKEIPFVSGINISLLDDLGRENVIVDGYNGIVIINPSKSTMEKYYKSSSTHAKSILPVFSPSDITTKDDVLVKVSANFDSMDDLEKLSEYNINSIGLIRTEFLFLQEAVTTLSMQFQIERYEEIIQGAKGALLTFRLFDIGSDKKIIEMEELEPNPALGCRSIRFLLKYPKIFKTQVKALYHASLKGNIQLLLPLITDYDEFLTAVSFIEMCRKEVEREVDENVPKLKIGCMVEVPSFALLADHFAKVCDFFSIGTNDLMQYTLAMDRICPECESVFRLYHPSIVRLIKNVVEAANKEGIEVSICGEAASCEKYTKLLVGLGIRHFSCSIRYVPLIREVLSKIDSNNAREIANQALKAASINEVSELMNEEKIKY